MGPFNYRITTTLTALNKLQYSHMSQKKILIIEDSADLADSLEDMLIFKGYNAIKVSTGLAGLKIAPQEKPDLILLDLKLPDVDGYEVLRKLRKDEWGKTARVLVLTFSVETKLTRPSSVWTAFCTIYKPRPVPSGTSLIALLARKIFENTRCCSATGIPIPLSLTVITKSPPCRKYPTEISPPTREYFTTRW